MEDVPSRVLAGQGFWHPDPVMPRYHLPQLGPDRKIANFMAPTPDRPDYIFPGPDQTDYIFPGPKQCEYALQKKTAIKL